MNVVLVMMQKQKIRLKMVIMVHTLHIISAKWMNASQTIAKTAILIVFITQFICAMIFLYAYEYINHTKTAPDILLYIVLVISRFIMDIGIGCNELSVNNLVYEWFSDHAFNNKLSGNKIHGLNNPICF